MDYFFLKYERAVKFPPLQRKLPSKCPALLGLKLNLDAAADNNLSLGIAISDFHFRSSGQYINDKSNCEGMKDGYLLNTISNIIHKSIFFLSIFSTKFSDGCRRPYTITCKYSSTVSVQKIAWRKVTIFLDAY